MYSNNIQNFQESTTILNARTKKVWKPTEGTSYQAIGLMSRVFTNGPGDWDSIPGCVIPKTQKMVLDAALLNTQHYKVRIKGKVEQSRGWSSTLHYTSVW